MCAEPANAPLRPSSPETKTKRVVTVEEQRQAAKAMRKYFEDLAYDKALEDAKVFGWTAKNEIRNGRWVMFGLLVGMMTEFATGANFVDQIRITLSNLGIADVYDF